MPDNERFVRWQAILREHLSYAVGLVLTLAVASIGYGFTLARDKTFKPHAGIPNFLFLGSLALLTTSVVLGIFCVLNRLHDFRGTAQRARGAIDASSEKEYLNALGKLTWGLFYCQIVAFGLGALSLGVAILIESGRLS